MIDGVWYSSITDYYCLRRLKLMLKKLDRTYFRYYGPLTMKGQRITLCVEDSSEESEEEEILFSDERLKIIRYKMENEPYCLSCECLKDIFYQRKDEEDPDFDFIRFSCSICLD